MANRKKRIERELTLVQDRENLKSRFKTEKQKRKDGQKTFLKTLLKADHPNDFKGLAWKKTYLSLFRRIRYLKGVNIASYQVFLKILKMPKPIFSSIFFYERMLTGLIKQTPCRSFESWKMTKSTNDFIIFKSLFSHLLIAYKIPPAVDEVIDQHIRCILSEKCMEADIMFHMIKGNGIHKFSDLRLEMNSKMNFLLNHAPKKYLLPEAMWWAKMKSMGVPYSIATKLVDNLYIQIETEWMSWLDDFIFFLKRFPKIGQGDLKIILDFIIAQKDQGVSIHINNSDEKIRVAALFPAFEFKGRTVVSVLKYVEKWRAYVQIAKEAGVSGEFKKSPIQPMRINQGKRVIRIRQIMNLKNLALEGDKMNHCVATYAGECLNGESSIWSMGEILAVGKVKRLITIEVVEKDKKIGEATGNSNRDLNEMEKRCLKIWTEKEGLATPNLSGN